MCAWWSPNFEGLREAVGGIVQQGAEHVEGPRWACPIADCLFRAELPWALERHAAVEHPGWTASFEGADQAQRADLWRVIYWRPDP